MKYSIIGIENSRIIKNIKVVDGKFIEVKYLDGKKDVIEYSGDNFNKIKDIMIEQAKDYIDAHRITSWKTEFTKIIMLSLMLVSSIASIIALVSSYSLLAVVFLLSSLCTGIIYKVSSKQSKYLEKYTLFLQDDFNQELDKYKDIMNKEKSLGKKLSKKEQKQVALKDITFLDNYSLEELKEIREKVSRYTSLVGENIVVPVLEEEKGKQKVKK